MPLDEYRKKRDFAQTPEPEGGTPSLGSPPLGRRRFVVQRHRARRLHYDLRLEVGDVLASWAVPRGPTLDPAVRRMAIHVEDHPLEYFDFEGVIPPGQYGAGDVIVWDWGTWQPEAATPDAQAAIAAGELKFTLTGEKLRGRFLLVRTGDRHERPPPEGTSAAADTEKQWLLLHKRDEQSEAGWDPEDHPRSVRSGLTNDDVKANAPAIWVSQAPPSRAQIDLSGAVAEAAAGFVPPMNATLATEAFVDDNWLFEVKWDGFRVEAVVRGDEPVRLFTRNGNDAGQYFGSLLDPADEWITAESAVVDGEVVALDGRGRPDFSLLQDRLGAARAGDHAGLVFQAFDLLHLDGRSLLTVPLEDRKKLLQLVLRDAAHVQFAEHVVGQGRAFLAAAAEQGLEGIVAKKRSSRYEPGRRGPTWLKVKIRPEQELVVGGWTPRRGSHDQLGSLVVGVYEGQHLRFAGRVGSGFTDRASRAIQDRLSHLQTEEPPFDPAPATDRRGRWGGDLAGVVWVRPEVVIRAELGGWTSDGMVRQSAFKGIELDRDPRLVVREVPVEVPAEVREMPVEVAGIAGATTDGVASPGEWANADELAQLAQLGAQGTWSVGGQEVKVTNLDKVLFPAADGDAGGPISKRELISYFTQVAPALLPHLAGRPLNLHRFPNGVDRPGFWQKDMPRSTPAWLTIWHETDHRELTHRTANDHLVADCVAALAWLANQTAFEIHAWTSTCADPGRPTYALIDIDPGTSTTWEETLTLARLFRTALEHLGVRGYPKTTGSRGVQVWVPIVRGKYNYAQTSEWVEMLSRAVGATVPDLVSWEWTKADRGGRARLDYTQNAPIKTLVAPYAVRPAAGAPVSMPITWDELDDPDLRSDRWTIRTALQRIDALGDLFEPIQTDQQDLPRL